MNKRKERNNDYQIEFLKWDSEFFGYRIGRVYLSNLNPKILLDIKEHSIEYGFKLVYIITNRALLSGFDMIENNLYYVDTKLNFLAEVTENNIELSGDILEISENEVNENEWNQLSELSYISGHQSRFKLDQHFEEGKFYDLYRIWLKNSLNKSISDFVFISKELNEIRGFITLKKGLNTGKIGLFAVSNKFQGKGIGKLLLNSVLDECFKNNLKFLEVETQFSNLQAKNFYIKNNMKINLSQIIYHLWN
jgi:dTDP-4-amino-4,6-dideoxy-D-galactose acyltransferase